MELFAKQPTVECLYKNKTVVHRSLAPACLECKRRKGKCVGNPCFHCVSKKLVCIFPEAKKRGPKTKQQNQQNQQRQNQQYQYEFSNQQNQQQQHPNQQYQCPNQQNQQKLPLTTQISALQLHETSYMHNIQMHLNNYYQKTNLVDFYFQYLGIYVPMRFKNALLSSVHSDVLKAQLCIISAHIVNVFGNDVFKLKFIQEAQKYLNFFTGMDTVEYAVAMLMMCLYIGHEDPKHVVYASMAYNITKLPNIEPTPDVNKVSLVSRALSIDFADPDRTLTLSKFFPTTPAGLTQHEWILSCTARLNLILMHHFKLADHNPDGFLENINSPLNPDFKSELLHQIRIVLDLGSIIDDSLPLSLCANYSGLNAKFIIHWTSGELQEAFDYGNKAMQSFRSASFQLALWCHQDMPLLLLVPYFMANCASRPDLAQEYLGIFEQAYSKLASYKQFLKIAEHLNLKVSANNSDFTDVENDLFNDIVSFGTSDSPIDRTANFSPPNSDLPYFDTFQ